MEPLATCNMESQSLGMVQLIQQSTKTVFLYLYTWNAGGQAQTFPICSNCKLKIHGT